VVILLNAIVEIPARPMPHMFAEHGSDRPKILYHEGTQVPCCAKEEGGLSEPSCRGRLQTAVSCFDRKVAVVNVTEKARL
jgi:hypothetical protein